MRAKIGSVVDREPADASSLRGAPVGMLGEGAVHGHTIPLIRTDILSSIIRDVLRPDHTPVLFVDGRKRGFRDDNLGLDHDPAISDLSDPICRLSATKQA